ncbi:MAG: metallopeptidase family protein [Actinobacteria bacterium]|jgi:predicted Zn-dependent protease with MMP-like domain|uniref:metallopeptidase family protein n=1 Tax=Propionicimonas sp. T2.31MG-18 TaxID=3157620 RepID=UPI0035EDAD04|nr:metallopeptidase family protein [Actinomycetota bacterium]
MALVVSPQRFEQLVDEALEQIPDQLFDLVENCALIVEEEPDAEMGDVLGYYDGTPLSDRTSQYSGVLPDRILIFRGPLLRLVSSEAELVEEIRITVWHEIAHFFGIDDDELDDLGYA